MSRALGQETRSGRGRQILVLLVLAGLVWCGLLTFRVGDTPTVAIRPALMAIGRATEVDVDFAESKRGLAEVEVLLVQAERTESLASETFTPRPPTAFWGPHTPEHTMRVTVGTETVDSLLSGEVTLVARATAAGTWLRHPEPVSAEVTLPVMLTPPLLSVQSTKHYAAQGGAELVLYRVGPSSVKDGVMAGDRWFPGYPKVGGENGERLAFFAVPFDLSDGGSVKLVAEDVVGNHAELQFLDRFAPRPFTTDDIRVSDGFLAQVVPEVMSQTPGLQDRGSRLENYLQINNDLRKRNAETLDQLAADSAPEKLWRGAFEALPSSQVMSSFADRRTYFYDGQEVDQQDHLGYDLASTRQASVPSANRGTVVLARYFGIYGNAVVIDHGYGLMSLYGHLSSIGVAEGQAVAKGDPIGRTGETGLAAGDHLHFTLLLHGTAVHPVEWFDPHWIEDRIDRKLNESPS